MTERIHDGSLEACQRVRDDVKEKQRQFTTKASPFPDILKRYPALAEYLWERLEEDHNSTISADGLGIFLKGIPDCILTVLEDDLRSGVFTPHFQRTVRTAWSDTEQRFVLTSDQGC